LVGYSGQSYDLLEEFGNVIIPEILALANEKQPQGKPMDLY
jgi:hypothetical protein